MKRFVWAVGFCIAMAGCAGPTSPTEQPTAIDPPPATSTPREPAAESARPPAASPGRSLTPTVSPTPTASPLVAYNGLVAYSPSCTDATQRSNCTGDPRLWVVNVDGTGAHELLPDGPGSQAPLAWSPDGSRLLFTQHSSDGRTGRLGWTDADGSAPEFIPTKSLCPVELEHCYPHIWQATLSPDGTRLAYAVFRNDGPGTKWATDTFDGTIAILEFATGHVTVLDWTRIPGAFQCCDGYYSPSWSADGTQLAFVMPPLTSYSINVDGNDIRQLGTTVTSPKWSPDGSSIVTQISGSTAIAYRVKPDGTDRQTLITDGWFSEWTRDGRILFSRDYPVDAEYLAISRVMDADGGNERSLDDTLPVLTAVGCQVCGFRDADGHHQGYWQPVVVYQP